MTTYPRWVTYEIDFLTAEDAKEGRRRLKAAGFEIEEATAEDGHHRVRASIDDAQEQSRTPVEAAVDGLAYDPFIYWQSAQLTGFVDEPPPPLDPLEDAGA